MDAQYYNEYEGRKSELLKSNILYFINYEFTFHNFTLKLYQF